MKIARIARRLAAFAAGITVAFFLGRYALSIAMGRIRLTGRDFIGEAAT